MGRPTDLVQGTLDLLILKVLSLEPAHGWAIAKRIQQISSDVLQVQQGSLYPALHRLEQQGWISAALAGDRDRAQREGLLADARGQGRLNEELAELGASVLGDQSRGRRGVNSSQ